MQVQGQHKSFSLKGPVQGAPSQAHPQHPTGCQTSWKEKGAQRGLLTPEVTPQSSTRGPRPRLPSPSATPSCDPHSLPLPGESSSGQGRPQAQGPQQPRADLGCRRPWGALFLLLHPQGPRPSPLLPNQALPTRASPPRAPTGSQGVCPQETSSPSADSVSLCWPLALLSLAEAPQDGVL